MSAKKIIVGMVGTVVLGAIGSGLWEIALKPAFQGITHLFLVAVSLGSSVFLDGLYREAARGLHEHGENELMILVSFAQLVIPIAWLYGLYLQSGRLRRMLKQPDDKNDPPELEANVTTSAPL